MVDERPYLPDVMQAIVSRVSNSFSARETDPFNVFFDKGILPQVRRSVYNADGNFPLVWFVMKYSETFGTNIKDDSEASFQLVIAMPTDNNYTQQQRDDISFKPRLIPIYTQLIQEMQRERSFNLGYNGIRHTRTLLPYWGLSDVNGADVDNLFKNQKIDALTIDITGLKVKAEVCLPGQYSLLDAAGYPTSKMQLTFFDDLELIVDGGNENDPVSETSSVDIPFLAGKDYEVQQRDVGQLRRRRNVEFIPADNGGFALQNGDVFHTGDTYIVKIRPMYLT